MKIKLCILLICSLIISGCSRIKNTIDEETGGDTAVLNTFDNTYYNTIISSGMDAREPVYNDFSSNQNDFNLVGRGLQVLSLDYFSNNNHFLREGTHFTRNDYSNLIGSGEYSIQTDAAELDGIANPSLGYSLLQQEYVTNGTEGYVLSGISMALAVTSDVNVDGVSTEFQDSTIEDFGRNAIPKIYNYMIATYPELASVPILIGVYQMAKSTDNVSGKYVLSSYCDGKVGDINKVDVKNLVFSSSDATVFDSGLSSEFTLFKERVKNAAADAVGVVGYGTYINGAIVNMRIDITLNTKTYTETISLMNLIASEMENSFTNQFDIKGVIYSRTTLQGFIIKNANSKAVSYTIY